MLWYNDNKNTIVFQGEGYTRGTPEYDYKLEWQRMRTVVDSCYREGRDPFVILTGMLLPSRNSLLPVKVTRSVS